MLERKDDLQCTISATEVRDDGVTLHCMTNMDDYGKVRFSPLHSYLPLHLTGLVGNATGQVAAR
ncbi:MAG: hypothetical protein CL580_01750 [Alteromonadaceae bacterium]|nr:hypothetical protein [Alteromonadaceae bacterium]